MALLAHLLRHSINGGSIMINPKYANELGGIVVTQSDGVDLYVDSGELYDAIVNGDYGDVEAYIPPTAEELLQAARSNMVVSRFQARAALHGAGLLDAVEAMMADPSTDMIARLAWQDAQEFRRLSNTVIEMGLVLGITDAQLDDLFEAAATITA